MLILLLTLSELVKIRTWEYGGVSIFYFVFWFLSLYAWMELTSRYVLQRSVKYIFYHLYKLSLRIYKIIPQNENEMNLTKP